MEKITPLFYGKIQGGKLLLDKPDDLKRYLRSAKGQDVVLSIKKAEHVRSSAENRYYWGVIVRMVADEMAVLPDEAHDFLKGLFLKIGIEHEGKRYEIVKSSADLSVADFEDYCEQCRQWAANELGFSIPLPNEIIIND